MWLRCDALLFAVLSLVHLFLWVKPARPMRRTAQAAGFKGICRLPVSASLPILRSVTLLFRQGQFAFPASHHTYYFYLLLDETINCLRHTGVLPLVPRGTTPSICIGIQAGRGCYCVGSPRSAALHQGSNSVIRNLPPYPDIRRDATLAIFHCATFTVSFH